MEKYNGFRKIYGRRGPKTDNSSEFNTMVGYFIVQFYNENKPEMYYINDDDTDLDKNEIKSNSPLALAVMNNNVGSSFFIEDYLEKIYKSQTGVSIIKKELKYLFYNPKLDNKVQYNYYYIKSYLDYVKPREFTTKRNIVSNGEKIYIDLKFVPYKILNELLDCLIEELNNRLKRDYKNLSEKHENDVLLKIEKLEDLKSKNFYEEDLDYIKLDIEKYIFYELNYYNVYDLYAKKLLIELEKKKNIISKSLYNLLHKSLNDMLNSNTVLENSEIYNSIYEQLLKLKINILQKIDLNYTKFDYKPYNKKLEIKKDNNNYKINNIDISIEEENEVIQEVNSTNNIKKESIVEDIKNKPIVTKSKSKMKNYKNTVKNDVESNNDVDDNIFDLKFAIMFICLSILLTILLASCELLFKKQTNNNMSILNTVSTNNNVADKTITNTASNSMTNTVSDNSKTNDNNIPSNENKSVEIQQKNNDNQSSISPSDKSKKYKVTYKLEDTIKVEYIEEGTSYIIPTNDNKKRSIRGTAIFHPCINACGVGDGAETTYSNSFIEYDGDGWINVLNNKKYKVGDIIYLTEDINLKPNYKKDGNLISAEFPNYKKEGFSFDGWYSKTNCSGVKNQQNYYVGTDTVNYYACWIVNE